jgi:D-beta-D-heptose 7-phosphate kinase/D-beta-D-heptose 1-phosphate adenosyltransferase
MTCPYEDLIRRFEDLRVAVVGDLMLDRYVTGRVRRISPEAPVPIVEVQNTYDRPGGAGNVAANVRRLGADTCIVGVVGADEEGARLRQTLASAELGVKTIVEAPLVATTVKTRIVAHGQQICRVDREIAAPVDGATAEALLEAFDQCSTPDVVILSDYAKGVLSRWVCADVLRRTRSRGIPTIVDPKGKDYARYRGATAVTPNQFEAAEAIGAEGTSELDFGALRAFFLGDLQVEAALVTQAERGMTLLLPEQDSLVFPASARDVADVCGAGDTAVSTFALALAAGASFSDAAYLSNVAAGVVVGKAGAVAISADELLEALQQRPATRVRRAR